jgi:hypothetical protein
MRKLLIVMAGVLCAGIAGLAWADDAAGNGKNNVNPQPLPPQEKQQVGGNTGNNEDGDSGIHPTDTHEGGKPSNEKIKGNNLPAGDVSLKGDGKVGTGEHFKKATIQSRKAGGDGGITGPLDSNGRKAGKNPGNLTQHDQTQISGNLNGDGKTSLNGNGKVLDDKHAGFEKSKNTKIKNGFIKGEKGNSKLQAGGGGGAGKGTQKVLIGLDKANNFKKANGLQKAVGPGGGAGIPGNLGETSAH